MQLDRTHVKIRARSLPEIGDLALILVRRYPVALLKGFCLGALPWAALNALLLGWIPIMDEIDGIVDEQTVMHRLRYVWLMSLLVFLQTPIAGVLTTYYIGQAVFEQRPPWRDVFTACRTAAWRVLWVLGVLRGPIPAMMLLATNWGQPFAPGRELIWMLLILGWAAGLRSVRPFLPEILLLERCPLRQGDSATISARRRSTLLHVPISGDLMGRFLAISLILAFMAAAFFYSLMFVRGILSANWDWSALVLLVVLPLALWSVAGLSVLIRFLCYLDARIRLEGWEVELALRAEALRQFGDERPVAAAAAREPAVRPVVGALALLCCAAASWVGGSSAYCQIPAARPAAEQRLATEAEPPASEPATAEASAKAAEALRSLGSSPWYDPQEDQLQPVPVKPVQDDSIHRDSRWLPKPAKVARPKTTTGIGGLGLIRGSELAWALLVLLLIGVVGLLVYAFSKIDHEPDLATSARSGTARDESSEQLAARMEQLPEELRGQTNDLRGEAERLMQSGRYDRAIICLFGHQLLQLDRHQMIRLARGKTNRQYVREATHHGAPASILRETMQTFEASYFGRHGVPADRFAYLWQQNLRLEELLQAHRTEAAA